MSIFQLFGKRESLEEGLQKAKNTSNSVILDVRTEQEYKGGHVPGSKNIPLDKIETISIAKTHPLFVYCLSGARAGNACAILKKKGYDVTNIGGISGYKGEISRGL